MAYIKIAGTGGLINLIGSYGYNTSVTSGLAAYTTIDARLASWIVSNSANQYPDATTSYLTGTDPINKYALIVYSAGYGLTVKGGTVWGQVPQTSDWKYTYNDSAAIRFEYAPGLTVEDWRIDKAWDAIRIQHGTFDFLIDDVHLSNIRDDALENDVVLSGTVRDSLFDGVNTGISLGNSSNHDGSANTITLQNVFIRHQLFLSNGEMTHGSPFKTNTNAPETTPDIRIINSVIAIEDPTHGGLSRLKLAWDNVVESRGNVFLNLSDTPLPSWYPMPPAGFTVLQGQAARDYWERVEAAWLDNHDGTPFADLTPLPALPGAHPVAPEPIPPVLPTNIIEGTAANNTLIGTSAADDIRGLAGDDWLYGRSGADSLTGGGGKDKFVFDSALGSGVDTIVDFSRSDDKIYLDNAIFTKLGSGSMSSPKKLNSGWLVDSSDAKARDSNDYILYDRNTGQLSYDADGNGVGLAIPFAQLPTGMDLDYWHFYVI